MRYIVDTNVLVLLVVGLVRPDLIGVHKRVRSFSKQDFLTLQAELASANEIMLSPYVLAELSNLATRDFHGPVRANIRAVIKALIDDNAEVHVGSRAAASRREYAWLGLVDAAIVEQCGAGDAILTDDGPLAEAALGAGKKVIYFRTLRDGVDG